jgi:transposase
MSKSQHTEAQMIGALKQLEAGRKAEDAAREVGVSKHTIYAWNLQAQGNLRLLLTFTYHGCPQVSVFWKTPPN